MVESTVIISDTQIPYHNTKALNAVFHFISDYQPSRVVQIGDLMDYPQPSQWSKGTAAEYEGSVYADSLKAQKCFFAPLRELYDGPVGVLEGNHDLRPRTYLSKYAPALAGSGAFNLDVLLNFPAYRVELLPDFWEFAPGWVMIHGHKGFRSSSQTPGGQAMAAAKRFDKSVVMGHTHKMGVLHHSMGYNQRVTKTLTGVEVGNLMDMKGAGYLKGSAGNWQTGFAIAYTDGSRTSVQTIPFNGRSFNVEGKTYTF